MKKPEIRKDYVQDEYVIIAPGRSKRPHDIVEHAVPLRPRQGACVFCPGTIERKSVVLSSSRVHPGHAWDIMVIENKFSAVSLDNPRAYGTQEVIVETREHDIQLHDLPKPHIAKILDMYAERTKIISENPKIEYILILKNSGRSAGASIQHSHSQIFASSFLPPHLLDKSQKAQAYKLEKGNCIYCDIIKKESRGARLIYKDKNIIAFAPYASMFNYECWIMPLRHIDNVTLLSPAEKQSWAATLQAILKKIVKLGLPYNYYFHQVVHDEDQHLYMKIVPRGGIWAGVEIGSGLIINHIAPETAAAYYRK